MLGVDDDYRHHCANASLCERENRLSMIVVLCIQQ